MSKRKRIQAIVDKTEFYSLRTQCILVGLVVVAAFLFRVLPVLTDIFTPNGVAFLGPDPWYQMRLVDNMIANFPQPLWNDAYALYPDGAAVGYRPILTWLVAGVSMLFGGASPAPELVNKVGAFIPPVIGALTIIPVYVIGATMFKRKAVGLIAIVLIAFLPTEFLYRSMLGFTDHHVLEIFFAVLVLMFLGLAWKSKKAIFGLPAGIFLGFYIWNWHGAPLFAGVLMGAFCLAFLIAYFKGPWKDWIRDPKWLAGVVCFLVAFVISLPLLKYTLSPREFTVAIVAIGLAPLLLILGGTWIKRRLVYLGLLVCILVAAVLVIQFKAPWIYEFVFTQLQNTFWGYGTTILEAVPMGWGAALTLYGFVSVVALAGIVYAFKYKVDLPFLIWSIVIILAMIGQRRWGYYATINIALFAAFFVVIMGRYIQVNLRPWLFGLTTIVLLLTTLPGITDITNIRSTITPDWQRTLEWVRLNTPDPFGDPDAYYEIRPMDTEPFAYAFVVPGTDIKMDPYFAPKQPSYAVMSWWDYGHYIIRDARRVPMSSPTQQETRTVYEFFIAQSEAEADAVLAGSNVRYIIIDWEMVETKFYAMVLKSGQETITMEYWHNSMAYRLYYGLVVGKYRAIFITDTVKVFEVFDE